MKARIFSVAALSIAVFACSSTNGNADLEDGASVESEASELKTGVCKPARCGPAPGMPAYECEDGTIGGNTGRCVREGGKCHWEIRDCSTPKPSPGPVPPPPKVDCGAPGACGPDPGAPAQKCDDGTIADAKCVDQGGKCGWIFETCPAPSPGAQCGKTVCSKTQTCCDGIPFTTPTCVEGTMCPISQRKHKKDVTYLSESDRQRLSDELLGFRLATYRYKSQGEGEREHLGFIIDDVAPSPAVVASGERVDMYGYATMAVATLQTQAREIAELRRQVDELKRDLGKGAARK